MRSRKTLLFWKNSAWVKKEGNGLGIFRNTSGPKADQKPKNIIKIFKECGLSITCEVNKKIVDFLDVWFNLIDQTYEPYRKLNIEPVYINKQTTCISYLIKIR